jgi:hypothetical protein
MDKTLETGDKNLRWHGRSFMELEAENSKR